MNLTEFETQIKTKILSQGVKESRSQRAEEFRSLLVAVDLRSDGKTRVDTSFKKLAEPFLSVAAEIDSYERTYPKGRQAAPIPNPSHIFQ